MKALLTKNLGLKIASLLLACILWFVIAQVGNPRDTKSFNNIPVVLVNTELFDAENKVYEVLDNTDVVRVTISAPISILSNLRTSDIIAEADVSKLTDINTIAIRYSIQNADVSADSISGDHEAVRLNVEEKSTKWIRVEHGTVGQVADGYIVYAETPDQTLIEVSGPESVISQVSYAKIELDVTGASANMSANVLVELYDKDNELMDQSNIKKNTDQIHMYVEILSTKEVGVNVKVGGDPEEGYLLTGETESSITSIVVAGTKFQLLSLNQITIPASAIDATGKEEDFVTTVDLRDYLPNNVKIADSSSNTVTEVTVRVEPEKQKTILVPVQNITIQNAPEDKDFVLDIDPSEYSFQVSGLERNLDEVRGGSVQAIVDVKAWMDEKNVKTLNDGTHEIPITLLMGEEIRVLNEQKARVKVSKVAQ